MLFNKFINATVTILYRITSILLAKVYDTIDNKYLGRMNKWNNFFILKSAVKESKNELKNAANRTFKRVRIFIKTTIK